MRRYDTTCTSSSTLACTHALLPLLFNCCKFPSFQSFMMLPCVQARVRRLAWALPFPIDTAKGLVEQVLKYGKVVRPVLGITIAPPQTVRQIGVEGVLVLEVPSGGPADRAGIKGTYRWTARPPPLCPKFAPNFSQSRYCLYVE